MARPRKYDIEVRVRLSSELKGIIKDTADKLEISESDVVRMLIRNLKDKGMSILE